MMWLTGRLALDFKTIRKACSEFVMLCHDVGPLSRDGVAIDGRKFKAVNNWDKIFTPAKVKRRVADIETSIECYNVQTAVGVEHHLTVAQSGFSRFVVAGGETSGAVVSGLKAQELKISPRIAPGFPVVRIGGTEIGLALVTRGMSPKLLAPEQIQHIVKVSDIDW